MQNVKAGQKFIKIDNETKKRAEKGFQIFLLLFLGVHTTWTITWALIRVYSCKFEILAKLDNQFAKYIQLGNYHSIANDYNHYFGPKYVYMVDGQAAMANPNDEFGRLIDFFGLTSKSIHFEFNESKGFHCLNKPVNYCLGDGKGTSRKEHVDLFRRVLELMFNFCIKMRYP